MSSARADLAIVRAILANGVLIRGESAWLVAALCDYLEACLGDEPMNAAEARVLTERANDDLGEKVRIVLSCWYHAIRRAATVGRNSVRSSDVDRPRTAGLTSNFGPTGSP